MDKYDLLQQIGDGTFGSVAKGVHKKTGQLVAVKRMKQKYYSWEECIKLPEVQVLRKLQAHPNIIKLREVVRENNELFFVFEFMDGDLLGVIRKCKQNMPPAQALTAPPVAYHKIKSYMFQLMQSLAFLHKNGYFHRDLKPENLLIRKDAMQNQEIIKLADFGLVKEVRARPPYTDYVSTRWYRAPELLLQDRNYTCAVDVWAAGCIFSELITTKPLFPGNNEVDQLFKIMSIFGSPNESLWPDGMQLARKIRYQFPLIAPTPLRSVLPAHVPPSALDLLSKMLVYDPKKRITAQQCLAHPYFNVGLDEEPLSAYCGAATSTVRPVGGVQSAPTAAHPGQAMHTPVQWRQASGDSKEQLMQANSANKAGLQQQQLAAAAHASSNGTRPASGNRPMFPPVEISKHHVSSSQQQQQQQQHQQDAGMSKYYLVPTGISPKQKDNVYGSPVPSNMGGGGQPQLNKPLFGAQPLSPPQRPPTKFVESSPEEMMHSDASKPPAASHKSNKTTAPSLPGPPQHASHKKPSLTSTGINLDELLEEFEVEMAGMGFQTKKESKPPPQQQSSFPPPHRSSPSPQHQQTSLQRQKLPNGGTPTSTVGIKGLPLPAGASQQQQYQQSGGIDQSSPIQKLLLSTRYKPSSSSLQASGGGGNSPFKDPPTPTFHGGSSTVSNIKGGSSHVPPLNTNTVHSPSAVTAANRYDVDSASFASLDVGAASHLGNTAKKAVLGNAAVSPSVSTLLSRQSFKPAQLPPPSQQGNDDDDLPTWLRMVNERTGQSRTTPTGMGKAPLGLPRR